MNSADKRNSVKLDYDLLNICGYDIIYEKDKHEEGKGVLGEDGNDAIYIIARKN